jgi:hypothetical protein
VDLRAWGASEGSSPAVDEREHLSKGFLRGIGMVRVWFGRERQKTFLSKQVFEVVATCCRMAYEQHLSKSIIQTHKALSTLIHREVRVAQYKQLSISYKSY